MKDPHVKITGSNQPVTAIVSLDRYDHYFLISMAMQAFLPLSRMMMATLILQDETGLFGHSPAGYLHEQQFRETFLYSPFIYCSHFLRSQNNHLITFPDDLYYCHVP